MNDAKKVFEELKDTVVCWENFESSKYVFSAKYRGDLIFLQLNDFPEEPLCSLVVNDSMINLDDLPVGWNLPSHRE